MKQIKLIISCLLIVSMISLTVISDYSSASVVYADDVGLDDVIDSVLDAILAVGGVFIGGAVGSVPGAAVTGSNAIMQCFQAGTTISDYITDNGDGTITVSPDGIQATIDALQQWEKVNGFSDEDIKGLNSGLSRTYHMLVDASTEHSSSVYYYYYTGSFSSDKRIGGYIVKESDGDIIVNTLYYDDVRNELKQCYVNDGKCVYRREDIGGYKSSSTYAFSNLYILTTSIATTDFFADYPVFGSVDDLENYLFTGNGYKNAINYTFSPIRIGKGFNFSSTYTGGSCTFSKERLRNLPGYIDKIPSDSDPDKAIDLIIKFMDGKDVEPEPEPETETETEIETDSEPGGGSGDGTGSEKEDSSGILAGLDNIEGWLKKIYNRLGEILNSLTKGFDDVVKQLKALKHLAALDVVADWLSFLQDLLMNIVGGIATLAAGFTEIGSVAKTKFPFSIPWDIAFIVNFLADNPKAPYFEFPIDLPAYGISEIVILDFQQFESISKISRLILTLVYMIGLMKMTDRIVSTKRGS